MVSKTELRQKRALVGVLAIGCIIAAVTLLTTGVSDAFASALLRVGLLLGAFWLVLPTRDRPAAWARVSPWSLGVVVVMALLLPRIKFFLPVLIGGVLLGWLVRPRHGRRQ